MEQDLLDRCHQKYAPTPVCKVYRRFRTLADGSVREYQRKVRYTNRNTKRGPPKKRTTRIKECIKLMSDAQLQQMLDLARALLDA